MTTSGLSFLMYFTRSASGSNDKLSDVENGPAAINKVISVEPTRRIKQEFSIEFSAQNLSFKCTKKKFYSMHNYILESKEKNSLSLI